MVDGRADIAPDEYVGYLSYMNKCHKWPVQFEIHKQNGKFLCWRLYYDENKDCYYYDNVSYDSIVDFYHANLKKGQWQMDGGAEQTVGKEVFLREL